MGREKLGLGDGVVVGQLGARIECKDWDCLGKETGRRTGWGEQD